MAEVNRQMAGLRRQAKKAERFKNYRDRARAIDSRLLLHYFDDLNGQIGNTETMLKELRDADIGHVTQLKKIDAAVEDIKLKRWQKNQQISAQKSDRFENQRKIDRSEAELAHQKGEAERLSSEVIELEQAYLSLQEKTATMGDEVAEIETQNEALHRKMDGIKEQVEAERAGTLDLQNQLQQLNQTLETRKNELMRLVAEEARYKNIYQNASNTKENIQRRLKRIDEEVVTAAQKVKTVDAQRAKAAHALEQARQRIAETEKEIEALKTALTEKATDLSARVKETQTLDLERNKARSQASALKKMAANFDWYRDGVKAIMRARKSSDPNATSDGDTPSLDGIVGLLAEAIEPEPGYETAVEAVLGDALQYVLVKDQQSGLQAIDYLRSSDTGRSGFIPVSHIKPLAGADRNAIDPEHRLLDHVSLSGDYQAIADALLGHVAVVPTSDEALSLFNRNGRIQTVVTMAGDVVSHQGLLIGGSQNQLAGILAKKQELKSLEEQVIQLEGQLERSQEIQKALESDLRQLETRLQEKTAQKHEDEDDALDAEKELYRLGEDLKNARRDLEIVELEQEQLIGEESDLDVEMAGYNQALAKISADVESLQTETATTSDTIGRVSSQLEARNQRVVDLKLELTALHAKLENGMHSLERLRAFERDSHQRLEQLKLDIAQKKEKGAKAGTDVETLEADLQKMYQKAARFDADLAVNESEYEAIDKLLQGHDDQVSQIQTEREKTLEKIRLVELDLAEKRMKKDNIIGKCQERYHISIGELRSKLPEEAKSLQMSVTELEKELQRLQTKIANIGDVNLGAIKEYDALKERFDFLCEQRDDLVKAIEDLHKVIRKINRITQERFMETYEQVNAKLQEVFPRLFEGGSARLELSEPDKPLETGVEFMVHPPGKKLTRMSLLSGGEKALSAIAFIFAIFLIRPASFCLLDEIDAPLDEANVIRFNNLLQVIGGKSQIIVITHNKRTMEFADTLFGVTMEQKGISKIVSVNLQSKAAA